MRQKTLTDGFDHGWYASIKLPVNTAPADDGAGAPSVFPSAKGDISESRLVGPVGSSISASLVKPR